MIYLILGVTWILLSDSLVHSWFANANEVSFQTFKGIFYVFISALLVYFLIKRSNARLLKKQKVLASNRELLQTITNNAREEMVLLDIASYTILMRNHILHSELPYGKEKLDTFLINFGFDETLRADTRKIVDLCATKQQEMERDFITSEEKQFTITFIPLKLPDTGRLLLVIKDKTEALLKEKEAKLYKEHLALILESEQIGLWEWVPPDHELKLNRNLRRMLNINEKDTISQKQWISMVHPDDRKKVEDDYRLHFLGNTDYFEGEYRILTGDGSYKWLVEYARVLERNDSYEAKRIIGVIIDFDPVKTHEATINAQARRLREFAYSNSHKVRAPLARILGLAKLLLETKTSVVNDQELSFVLTKIDESAEELDQVLQDFASQLNREQTISN